MKVIIIVGMLICSVASFAATQNPYFRFQKESKVNFYSKGAINWTKGYFLGSAKGVLNLKLKNVPYERIRLEEKLVQKAKINLLNIILNTKVDSYNYVNDYFNKSRLFKILFLEEVEKNMIILPPVYLGSGEIEMIVKYNLYGKGSLTDLVFRLNDYVESIPQQKEKSLSQKPIIYSSVIIDLRKEIKFLDRVSEKITLENVSEKLKMLLRTGNFPKHLRGKIRYDVAKKLLIYKGVLSIKEKDDLLKLSEDTDFLYQETIQELYDRSQRSEKQMKFSLSLFPSIYDSEGNLVYLKDMIELDHRSKIQYVQYTKDPLLFYKLEIVGNNPLYIVADKFKGENNSNIIINREKASKLFLDAKTIQNLKKGKIFLLVD